jgi:hypothetical protein
MLKRVFLLCLAAVGCVEEATVPRAPEQILPIQLTATDRDLGVGERSTLTVTLTNTLDQVVRLRFPTSCQAQVYIRNSQGRIVTPDGGRYECASVPSLLTIPVGQAATFDFTWSGEQAFGPPGTAERLPTGSYYASAELRADGYTAIAYPILITLR